MTDFTERTDIGVVTATERSALTQHTFTERSITTISLVAATIATISITPFAGCGPTDFENTAPILTDVGIVGVEWQDPETLVPHLTSYIRFTTNIPGTTKITYGLLPDESTWTGEYTDSALETSHSVLAISLFGGHNYYYYRAWSKSADDLWGHSEIMGPVRVDRDY